MCAHKTGSKVREDFRRAATSSRFIWAEIPEIHAQIITKKNSFWVTERPPVFYSSQMRKVNPSKQKMTPWNPDETSPQTHRAAGLREEQEWPLQPRIYSQVWTKNLGWSERQNNFQGRNAVPGGGWGTALALESLSCPWVSECWKLL